MTITTMTLIDNENTDRGLIYTTAVVSGECSTYPIPNDAIDYTPRAISGTAWQTSTDKYFDKYKDAWSILAR